MIENIDFYCTSHKNVDYLDDFKILTLIGCGEKEFSPKWKFFNNKSNINHKFVAYADLTAQYSIWKNIIKNDLKADKWISFSQYRRHWLNEKFNPNKPYKLQLVGLELGGKPIEEYAPDFWLISPESGGDPVGFITSPWYHPEKKQNIAMGYVPFDGTLNANGFPKGKVGTKYKVHLPDIYSETPGTPVDAVVVDIPFKESFNANTREVVKG
jgi:hypothetical protein